MYRLITTFLLLVATAVASSAQGLAPSVWQSDQGAIMKVLSADPATGNLGGVFISSPTGPCPAVPYDMVGSVRGTRVIVRTSREWTPDCSVTAVWFGRLIGPTTVAARFIARYVAADGRVVRIRGREIFQRI